MRKWAVLLPLLLPLAYAITSFTSQYGTLEVFATTAAVLIAIPLVIAGINTLVEFPIVRRMLRDEKILAKEVLALVWLANIITSPLFFYELALLPGAAMITTFHGFGALAKTYIAQILIIGAAIITVEFVVYRKRTQTEKRALTASIIANIATAAVGAILLLIVLRFALDVITGVLAVLGVVGMGISAIAIREWALKSRKTMTKITIAIVVVATVISLIVTFLLSLLR